MFFLLLDFYNVVLVRNQYFKKRKEIQPAYALIKDTKQVMSSARPVLGL